MTGRWRVTGRWPCDRHVRCTRQRYRSRRDRLVITHAAHAPHIEVAGLAADLLPLSYGTDRSTSEAAVGQDVTRDGPVTFRHPESPEPDMPSRDGAVEYTTPSEHVHAHGAALDALCEVMPPG